MDWLMWVVLPTLLSEIQAVSLNPFAAFADQQYEPVADYSIHRSVYLPNMPTTSIFPLMEENINGMVGIPALQTPFVNPLLQQQPSLFTVAKQTVRSKARNTRLNQHAASNVREQGNAPQNPRAVTLDIRGGGYRLEQPRSQRPYKPPSSGGNQVRNNSQRPNGNRNAASSVNRKQVQRPRNPYFNGKFESSLPSNVEFVNPENVLPLHPRIYKQFLQQNPQAAAALLKAYKQPSSNFARPSRPNSFQSNKQTPPKLNRNRGVRPSSHSESLSSFSNVPTNFQIPSSQSSGSQSNFGLQGLTHGRQPTFEDFYNSDPQFYAALSQTPEGKAMINQMYQHFGPSANNAAVNVQNKAPANIVPDSKLFAHTYADINSYSAATGLNAGNLPSGQNVNQYSNNFAQNKPNIPDYQSPSQYNQKPQQSVPQQQIPQQQFTMQHQLQAQQVLQHQQPQQVMQHQQQPQQVMQHQQPQLLQHQQPQSQVMSHSSVPSSPQISSYSGRQPYEDAVPSPAPTLEPEKLYTPQQSSNNRYNPYSTYSEESPSSFANSGPSYDPSTYQSSYQENPKVVDGSTVDHAAYASNFSPMDPLKTIENTNAPSANYYSYPSSNPSSYVASSSRFPSTALHEISPSEIVKRPSESVNSHRSQTSKTVNAPGYWTPEQLFAPESTGLQNDSPFAYPSAISSTSQQHTQDEQQDGSERAALHLPEEQPSWPIDKTQDSSASEYSEASSLDAEEGPKDSPTTSTEQPEDKPLEDESDEHYKATIRDLQKLWTRVPQRTSFAPTRATTVIYRSTEAPPPPKSTRDELRNHKTTPSYTFQYSPSDKTHSKSTAAWWSRKPDGSRYKIPAPQPNTTTTSRPPSTTPTSTTSTTTTTTTTTTTEKPEPTYNIFTTTTTDASSSVATTTPPSTYQGSDDTPICARHNNLTYCLQDPEYPKEAIREAIERNRHPLDHFLVDISAASNLVEDQSPLHSVFENSAPLQSTSVSYSFEGKVISPNAGEMLNSTGCSSNVYYAKPLRALNTAGIWKVIVNVEFEDTGANYTQTVRLEECTHPPGYVATCGVHSISACLQQYKLYRLLSWEAHRGFYIDAFLLPVACFCGSQDS